MPFLRSLRPTSFSSLVLLGFTLAVGPLLAAVVHSASRVSDLQQQARATISRAVRATQLSGSLVTEVKAFERKARLYSVLADAGALEGLLNADLAVRRTCAELRGVFGSEPPGDSIVRMERIVDEISRAASAGPLQVRRGLDRFQAMTELAEAVRSGADRKAYEETKWLETALVEARRVLLWQAGALGPLALGLAGLFSLLIARPVAQMAAAIERIGQGDWGTAVRISGPKDLRFLGERLNWLRHRLDEDQGDRARRLAQLSHDLKSPLASLREGSDLLLEGAVGPLSAPQREVVQILWQNCLGLQRAIQRLLDSTIPQGPAGGSTIEEVALDEVAYGVLADHKPAILKKELRVSADINAVSLRGDPLQVRAVVDNLLSNAVKFAPSAGNVGVSVRREGDGAVIEVSDSGPGVAPEDKERVFDAFYQGSRRAESTIKGSGLGLAIAKECAAAQGGTIEILDRRRGACFRVRLPLGRPA